MRKIHNAWIVLFFVFFFFLFGIPATNFATADNKIITLEKMGVGSIIAIPSIGIKKASFHNNKSGITIIDVDKLGPLRWVMIGTRIISITQYGYKIFLNDIVDGTENISWISWLESIKNGDEIFIQFLYPGETNERKIETREVTIRFSFYLLPDFTDYSTNSSK